MRSGSFWYGVGSPGEKAGVPGVQLPADPDLSVEHTTSIIPVLPPLRTLVDSDASLHVPAKSTSVVISEGMPPVASKIVEKIRCWDFVDLSQLLHDPSQKELTML